MISLVTCSRNPTVLDKLKENVALTIGVEHEWVVIDNADGGFGICKAYNTGADRARFDLLCFIHEDILFETQGWGINLVRHLSDPEVGLVGIAGGDTKSLVPSSWPSYVRTSEMCIVQHFKVPNRAPERIRRTNDPDDLSVMKPVTCLDGVFLCTRKDVFSQFRFDEVALPSFHGYDVDYSLQVGTCYKVCVVFDILLHHFSEGNFSREWLQSCLCISRKWSDRLPVSVKGLSHSEFVHQHWTAMRVFIGKMIILEYSYAELFLNFLRFSFNRYFNLLHFLHFLRLIVLAGLFDSRSARVKLGIQ